MRRPFQDAVQNEYGIYCIEFPEDERITIKLGSPVSSGYLIVGDSLRSLPIGSTLDADKGLFYWQPGPGFIGKYDLVSKKDRVK